MIQIDTAACICTEIASAIGRMTSAANNSCLFIKVSFRQNYPVSKHSLMKLLWGLRCPLQRFPFLQVLLIHLFSFLCNAISKLLRLQPPELATDGCHHGHANGHFHFLGLALVFRSILVFFLGHCIPSLVLFFDAGWVVYLDIVMEWAGSSRRGFGGVGTKHLSKQIDSCRRAFCGLWPFISPAIPLGQFL